MTDLEPRTFPADELHDFSRRAFESFGAPPGDACRAADVLILADLRGIDSHGIARLRAYTEMLDAGRINPKPDVKTLRESPSTATVDGDNGLGLVVAPIANEIAMDKAEAVGTGWVTVRGSNHYGIAGYYVLEALKRDQIGWSMTNTTKMVAPLWGAERMLGTNPIAIAFPGFEEPPVVIDMATTAAAFGKVEMAIRRGTAIPEGWAIGGDGRATTDPVEMAERGALSPLGSERMRGGHKGYCLAAMVDLLSGPLAGANWGPFTPSFTLKYPEPSRQVGVGLGHFFGAMKIEAFVDPDEFKRQVDEWVRTLRAAKPAPDSDGPLIPGDPEREAEAKCRRHGVPLIPAVLADLRAVSQLTGVPGPW
ncbi:MAG: Ldh family oxidoreductase [Planctomycetaceae bacterium]